MSDPLKVASGFAEFEIEIKKSRFIAIAGPAENRDQALLLLEKTKAQYPDARHHCWAYLLGGAQLPSSAAMNDDGEPSGTAGKPILNVLQHKGISDVMLIVVRYFGGVKLGAGGLVRAYSQAAEAVMRKVPFTIHVAQSRWQVSVDFSLEQPLRHFLSENEGNIDSVTYTDTVNVSLSLPTEHDAAFDAFCAQHQLKGVRLVDE
ncbi:YigZ family protein [Aliidiomarina shirensis]|uniref:YigZ family protein n=1 Tax=Aliidiomarina shirensis TaxID=1048642 RepID=A0A432WYI1_9GAMM|nr:YigZ family protein [Aliidiomarina shirensis]RUO38777.1 YigZ family protein [Aliidiomarina shirensis]